MEGLVLLWNILELGYNKIRGVPIKIVLMKEWMHCILVKVQIYTVT